VVRVINVYEMRSEVTKKINIVSISGACAFFVVELVLFASSLFLAAQNVDL
jgi:hypothetical protein